MTDIKIENFEVEIVSRLTQVSYVSNMSSIRSKLTELFTNLTLNNLACKIRIPSGADG